MRTFAKTTITRTALPRSAELRKRRGSGDINVSVGSVSYGGGTGHEHQNLASLDELSVADDGRVYLGGNNTAQVFHADEADSLSAAADSKYLHKDADDETPHKLTANALEARTNITAQSITIGGITISVQNGALVVGGNLAATGGITALQ